MRIKLTHIYEWLINVMNIQGEKILMSDKIDSQRILVSRGYHTHKLYCTYKQTDRLLTDLPPHAEGPPIIALILMCIYYKQKSHPRILRILK